MHRHYRAILANLTANPHLKLFAHVGRVLQRHREGCRGWGDRADVDVIDVIFVQAEGLLDLLGAAAAQPDLVLQQLLDQLVLVLEDVAGKVLCERRDSRLVNII